MISQTTDTVGATNGDDMAVIDISLVSICPGGGHITVSAAINGGAAQKYTFNRADIVDPPSREAIESAVRVIFSVTFGGKAAAVVDTELSKGVQVLL